MIFVWNKFHAEAAPAHDNEGHGAELLVIFIVAAMFLGVLTRYTKQSINHPFPYTVVLLVVGCLINGFALAIGYEKLGVLGEILGGIVQIDPHTLLLAFIPVLIFESAFSVNFHIMYRQFGQALLLAGPGVIINSLLTAVFMQYVVPYDWTFAQSWLFGTIVSATDPVAVVSLLRELGASKRLATLIEGESLLNDGSAFVLFEILLVFAEEREILPTTPEIIQSIFQLSLVGPVFGIAVAGFFVLWLERVFNDALVETSMTLIAAYLTFEIAENSLHTSGVLAVVFLGLTFSRYKSAISPKTEHALHHVWDMLSYIANTLIFLLSGVIIIDQIFADNEIHLEDFGWGVIIFIGVHITRMITLLVLYKPLQYLGYGFSWQEAALLTVGALRGAIGLALGLITFRSPEMDPVVKDVIMFQVAFLVATILIFNGVIIKYILRMVHIDSGVPESKIVMTEAMRILKKKESDLVEYIRNDDQFAGANWDMLTEGLPDFQKRHPPQPEESELGSHKEGHDEMRHHFLSAMKSFYWQQHEEGQVSKGVVNILNEAAESALDDRDLNTQWEILSSYFEISKPLKMTYNCKAACCLWFAQGILYRKLSLAVELVTAYICASERMGVVMDSFPEFQGLQAVDFLTEERKEFERKAYLKLNEFRLSFPEIYCAIQTKNAANYVLHSDHKFITKLLHDGIINETECDELHTLVERHMLDLTVSPAKAQNARQILNSLPFVRDLPEKDKKFVVANVTRGLFEKDEYLFSEQKASCIYVITLGQVSVQVLDEDRKLTFGVGTVVGAWQFLSGRKIHESCQAETHVEAWIFQERVIGRITAALEANTKLWKIAAADICRSKFSRFFQLDHAGIYQQCMSGRIERFEDDSFGIKMNQMTLLLSGQATTKFSSVEKVQHAPVMMRFFVPTTVHFSAGSQFLVFHDGEDGEPSDKDGANAQQNVPVGKRSQSPPKLARPASTRDVLFSSFRNLPTTLRTRSLVSDVYGDAGMFTLEERKQSLQVGQGMSGSGDESDGHDDPEIELLSAQATVVGGDYSTFSIQEEGSAGTPFPT